MPKSATTTTSAPPPTTSNNRQVSFSSSTHGQSIQQVTGSGSTTSKGNASPGFGFEWILVFFVFVIPAVVIRRRKNKR